MLRVGLTGDLGSGKSTVAQMLASRGAHVFASDDMARAMMQPGQPVYRQILAQFGAAVVREHGSLDRAELARLAFDPQAPRAEELNAIVHPAVLAEQARLLDELARREPDAIAVVESALLFTTPHAGPLGWRARFDVVVLVTASEATKLRRFTERVANGRQLSLSETEALATEARRRLALQSANAQHAAECIVIENDGSLEDLQAQVDGLWKALLERRNGAHR